MLILQKLTQRTLALEKTTWATSKKAQMAKILSEVYMSSEERDVEGNFTVKELAWESRKLQKREKQLVYFIINNTASA